MNTKQRDTWQQLVQQCEAQCTQPYCSSINVASQVRSEAIVAAGNLVELVTPELAALLERLATWARGIDCAQAYKAAARIKEALDGV